MPKPNPTPPDLQPQDILRFWSKVKIRTTNNACWLYMGERQTRSPYGSFTFWRGGRRRVNAHRIAFLISTGIWSLLDICHHCDNPPCCNPAHLFKGTRADNMQDAARKGRTRTPKGIASPRAKLNDDAIKFIRETWASRAMTRKAMAEMFKVSMGAIQQVTDGRRWKHVV